MTWTEELSFLLKQRGWGPPVMIISSWHHAPDVREIIQGTETKHAFVDPTTFADPNLAVIIWKEATRVFWPLQRAAEAAQPSSITEERKDHSMLKDPVEEDFGDDDDDEDEDETEEFAEALDDTDDDEEEEEE